MSGSYSLGKHFEIFVQAQLASGRYGNTIEVLRDALRLMEDRERRLGLLDLAIERSVADIRAGRLLDPEAVFAELEAELMVMPETTY